MHRLITIPISHFCEKARWALDRAGIEYVEERHVQGISRVYARRAGSSTGTTPVLVPPSGPALVESADICAHAGGDALRARDPDVVALVDWLDTALGLPGRRLIYAHMLPNKDALMAFNNDGVPAWEARLLTKAWPVVGPWAAKQMGIGPGTRERDEALTLYAFDCVAERLADGRPYLCGDDFTAADLTFAALSAPVTAPPQYGTPLPQPADAPGEIGELVNRFRAHPAGEFALRLYREQRPAPRRPARSAHGTASS